MPSNPHMFRAVDSIVIAGRGRVFTGPWPIPGTIQKHGPFTEWAPCMTEPWQIDHSLVEPRALYRIVGIETFAILTLHEGQSCGLMVKPWEEFT